MTEKIDRKKLMANIKVINDSGLLKKAGLESIRVVGSKTTKLVNEFGDAVDALADAKLVDKLDAEIIIYYNELFNESEPEESEPEESEPEKESEPEESEPEEKKSTPKKKEKKKEEEPKEKKKKSNPASKKPRSCYGHIASAKSGQLDELLNEGATYGDLMETCDVKLHRVKGHISVLKKKGLTVLVKEDKKDNLKTHVQIKEDSV